VAAVDEARHSPAVLVLGVPDRYIPQGSPAGILAELGLDGPGIAASTLKAFHAGGLRPGSARPAAAVPSVAH
jgi:deoxyxylulose-5-phosphate synthase